MPILKLKDSYTKIYEDARKNIELFIEGPARVSFNAVVMRALEKCQALDDKPVKRLSDEQIIDLGNAFTITNGAIGSWLAFSKAVIDAHIKLNSEPEEVPFDYALWSQGGWQAIIIGKNETHEVPMIYPADELGNGAVYVMRRKS